MTATQALKERMKAPAAGAQPTTIEGMVTTYKNEIARALPRALSVDRFLRMLLTEFRHNPALKNCNPLSLMAAAVQAAQLGLEPGSGLGHCYLVPFKDNRAGTINVQLMIGYKGLLDLARRSGQVLSFAARAVYPGDDFEFSFGIDEMIRHKPAAERGGELTYTYAVCKLRGGGIQVDVMSRADVERHRARSRAKNDGPWVTDYDAMALKTVARRLLKWCPISIEMQKAIGVDEAGDAGIWQGNEALLLPDYVPPEVPPATTTEGEAPADEKPNRKATKQAPAETKSAEAETKAIEGETLPPEGAAEQGVETKRVTFAEIADRLAKAKTKDELDIAADLIGSVEDAAQRGELVEAYKTTAQAMEGQA